MNSILFIYGTEKSWAIGNRVKNLTARLQGKYNITGCTKDQIGTICGSFQIVHAHSITYCPVPRKLVGGVWGFSLVSYRSLSPSRMKNNIRAFASTDFVVAKSPNLQRIAGLRARKGSRVVFIPNGVDLSVFKPRTYLVGWCGSKVRCAYEYKGVNYIVKAVEMINKEGLINVKFVEDPSNPPLVTYPPDVMVNFYQDLDVFVSASIGEGCSNVVLEALACGVPVVMTKTGIHGQLKSAGVVVVDRSVVAIKNGILQCLLQKTQARQAICKQFSWDTVADQYISLYTSLGFPPG
jgi:glycosyltransferase involved in cell wall biosynthesis